MKKSMAVGAVVVGVIASAAAQEIMIDSISQNGSMSFWGAQVGTTATVEWAASLTDIGRTNWHNLTNILVTADVMTNDIPMFFRVRGIPDTNLLNGLVAYYPFNGNANDESGNGHNGLVSGAVLVAGNSGTAYSFNGTNAYIQVPHHPDLNVDTNGFTVTAWFRANSNEASWQGIRDIIDKSHGDNGQIDDGTGWAIQAGSSEWSPQGMHVVIGQGIPGFWGTASVNAIIFDDRWHHFAATYHGTNIAFYLDGLLVAAQPWLETPVSNDRDLFIGKHYALGRYFCGIIDEVRIYRRALALDEVAKLAGKP